MKKFFPLVFLFGTCVYSQVTVSVPASSVAVPASTVSVPASTVAVPASTAAVPATQITIPAATATTAGVIKIGPTMTIVNGVANCIAPDSYNPQTGIIDINGTQVNAVTFTQATYTETAAPPNGTYNLTFTNGVQGYQLVSNTAASSGTSAYTGPTVIPFQVAAQTIAPDSATAIVMVPIPASVGTVNRLTVLPPISASTTTYNPYEVLPILYQQPGTSQLYGEVQVKCIPTETPCSLPASSPTNPWKLAVN
jgi:hypothetical protein